MVKKQQSVKQQKDAKLARNSYIPTNVQEKVNKLPDSINISKKRIQMPQTCPSSPVVRFAAPIEEEQSTTSNQLKKKTSRVKQSKIQKKQDEENIVQYINPLMEDELQQLSGYSSNTSNKSDKSKSNQNKKIETLVRQSQTTDQPLQLNTNEQKFVQNLRQNQSSESVQKINKQPKSILKPSRDLSKLERKSQQSDIEPPQHSDILKKSTICEKQIRTDDRNFRIELDQNQMELYQQLQEEKEKFKNTLSKAVKDLRMLDLIRNENQAPTWQQPHIKELNYYNDIITEKLPPTSIYWMFDKVDLCYNLEQVKQAIRRIEDDKIKIIESDFDKVINQKMPYEIVTCFYEGQLYKICTSITKAVADTNTPLIIDHFFLSYL